MFDYQLFLGLPLSDSYQKELKQLSAAIRDIFIQTHSSPYLQQIESEGMVYLGKYLGPSIELAALDSLQAHIYSLLKKLIPHYPYEQHSLLLFALPLPSCSL
jgi:hypothetical protein